MCGYYKEVYWAESGTGPEVSGDNKALQWPSLPSYTEALEKDFADAVPVAFFCSGHMGCEIKQIAGNVQSVLLSLKRLHFFPR